MLKRTITGAFITAATYLIIYFSHIPTVILCATAVLCAFAVYEVYYAAGISGNEALLTLSLLAAVGVSFLSIPHYIEILGIVFALSIVIFLWLMIRQNHCRLKNPFKVVCITALILLLFKAIPELRSIKNGLYYLAIAVTLCFITDIAAYLVGKAFGKHKLIPSVSPNKTVEGSVAGVVFAVLMMLLGGILLEHFEIAKIDYLLLAIYAALASVVGQFGDLAMSSIKRICRVKDFGNLFPGHGGVLDRFDSHLFTVAFTLLFCSITGGFIL